jgi:hypothetical protein
MKIEYYHASKYGNGAKVAEEFKRQMTAKGVTVNVYHVREVKPKEVPKADLYVFSSPGRFGKPIGDMRNFLKKANMPPRVNYAVIVTELCPNPDSNIERIPTGEAAGKCQRVLPIMNQLLQAKDLVKVAENKIFVTGLKGPLEEGWQKVVEDFTSQILINITAPEDESLANSQVMSAV